MKDDGQAEDQLAHVGSLMHLLPSGVLIVAGTDADTATFADCNESFERIAGQRPSPGTPLGALAYRLSFDEAGTPMERHEMPAVRAIEHREVVQDVEVYLRRPDGELRVVLVSACPLYRGSQPVGAVVLLQDITTQKRLQREAEEGSRLLRESEERFRALADHAPDVIARFDCELRHLFANQAAARLSGVSADWMIGKTMAEVGAPRELAARLERGLREAMDRGEIMTIDVPAPGDAVLHEAKLVPEFGVDGITTSLLLIARDVTERRRAEEEHRRQREILDSVIRAVPGPIIVIGGDPPRVYLSNPAFRKLTPHPELDPNGRTLVELFESGDHLPRRLEETRQLLREGKPGAGSLTLDCGGIRRVFDYQTLPMVWLGEPALVAVLWDITRLQELTEQRDDLLRTISHDIRTPLNTMLLHAQIIAELAGPESPLTRRADSILTSGRQVARMISDMVDVARLESGTLELELEPVDFAAYVAELLERLAGTLDMDRVRLETEARLAPVVLDPRRFERVLVNLISNALKYSSDEVVVRICPRAPHVALEVLDRGVGIVPEDQPKIFQRYYRSGTPSAREGLGLGLYIVTMLVQAHGGKIELESEPGEGSVFRVLLPLQPALSSE